MDTPQPADVVVVFVFMSELVTISSRCVRATEPGLLGPSVVSRVTSIPGGVTIGFRVLYAV